MCQYKEGVYYTPCFFGARCMTKGNPIVPVRLTAAMLKEMDEAIKARNLRTREEPWERGSFIRCAIRDKLHHMKRSRRSRRPRRPASGSESPNGG